MIIYKCPKCGQEISPEKREGMLDIISHIVYEIRKQYDFTGSEDGDKRYADHVLDYFEKEYIDTEGCEEDYKVYEPFYRAYRSAKQNRR